MRPYRWVLFFAIYLHGVIFFTEDDDVTNIEDTRAISSELGSIKVVVHEVQAHDHVKVGYILHELPPLQVNEKAKKGIVHGTQWIPIFWFHSIVPVTFCRLGAEVRSKTRRPRKTSKIRRIATFLFQYRPLGEFPFTISVHQPNCSDTAVLQAAGLTSAPTRNDDHSTNLGSTHEAVDNLVKKEEDSSSLVVDIKPWTDWTQIPDMKTEVKSEIHQEVYGCWLDINLKIVWNYVRHNTAWQWSASWMVLLSGTINHLVLTATTWLSGLYYGCESIWFYGFFRKTTHVEWSAFVWNLVSQLLLMDPFLAPPVCSSHLEV